MRGGRVSISAIQIGRLISLLVFEVGVGLFVGAPGIPLDAWLIVTGFGILYVCFFA